MSILLKIFAPVALLICSIALFLFFYIPDLQTERATAALETKAVTVNKLIAHTLAPRIDLTLNMKGPKGLPSEVNPVFASASQDDDLRFIALYDVEGRRFKACADRNEDELGLELTEKPCKDWTSLELSWTDRGDSNARPPRALDPSSLGDRQLIHTDGSLRVLSPIQIEGKVRGWLLTEFSLASVEAERKQSEMLASTIGGLTLLVGLTISLALGFYFNRRMKHIARVAHRFATGDLNQTLIDERSRDAVGHLAQSINRMLTSQRQLVSSIAETARQIDTTAGEILSNSQEQQDGTVEQFQAVDQTRSTMERLRDAGQIIAETSQGVLDNAELTLLNNRQIGRSIGELSGHSQRIADILEVIKDIANKSDLLALNAALEGTKAGEAGRGFSLVAQQMQRLAENVMQSAVNIKELTSDIKDATGASVLASEEALRLAADTTESARRINDLAQQQQLGTEHATSAMDGIHDVAQRVTDGNRLTVDATTRLVDQSRALRELISTFRIDQIEPPRKPVKQ